LVQDLRAAFGACGVAADDGSVDGGKATGCAWDCTLERALARVRFEVRVFATDDRGSQAAAHLVEVRHLGGCRYAFAEGAAALATHLRVAFQGGPGAGCSPRAALRSPPPLSPDALLELLQLASCALPDRGGSGGPPHAAAPPTEPVSAADAAACALDGALVGGGDSRADELSTAQHVLALLAAGAGSASQTAGCRAVAALALELADCMGSCPCAGACGANHRNHHALFASGGAWLGLAARVQDLASGSPDANNGHLASATALGDADALRSVAMAAVANVAALEHVCSGWLAEAVHTASGALVASGTPTEDVHVKREALRAAHVLASRDARLAAQLAAVAGCLAALELEASGGEGGSNGSQVDVRAVQFAQGALDACTRV
jgi:hypothetical protein